MVTCVETFKFRAQFTVEVGGMERIGSVLEFIPAFFLSFNILFEGGKKGRLPQQGRAKKQKRGRGEGIKTKAKRNDDVLQEGVEPSTDG